MSIIQKIQFAAWSVLFAAGLAASSAVYADGQSDVASFCPGCHGVTVNGVVVASDGAKNCLQRTATEWEATINRMNGKGCGVPSGSIVGMASYLAGVGSTSTTSTTTTSSTTTTTWIERCNPFNRAYLSFSSSSLSFAAIQGGSLPVSQSLNVTVSNNNPSISPYWQVTRTPTWLSISPAGGGSGSTATTVSITSTQLAPGVYTDSIDFYAFTGCQIDSPHLSTFPVTLTIDPSISTTTSSSTTTVSSTTTTTLCNTYVNGTTQFPYSGSGSCHSFAIDDLSGAHIVRDQSYCKKHMSHFNSKGNHVHAYPHPACM